MELRSQHNPLRDRSISNPQLALRAQGGFDIPPRTRRLIAVAGLAGIIVILVGSLEGGADQTIEVDKVLHFSGYALLAALFVLALRPLLFVPALLTLIGMGFLVEYFQSFTGRNMDVADGVANTLGVAVGASIAVLIRSVYAYLRREMAMLHVRRNLMHFPAGGLILREGGRVRSLYVIKSGQVRLSKQVGDQDVELGRAQAGDVVGALGVLLGIPQFTTVEAVGPTTLYRMELSELMDSVGGREQPVGTVLRFLAESLRYVAERMARSEAERDELLLATETHRESEPSDDLER